MKHLLAKVTSIEPCLKKLPTRKLSAVKILAIDNDTCSLENARVNIELNECSRIKVINNSKVSIDQKFDIFIANINKNIILENLSTFYDGLVEKCVLLIGGLLIEDLPEILQAASDFKEIRTLTKDNWLCLRFESRLLKTVD